MRWDIIWDFWIPKNPPFRLEVHQTIPPHCSLAPVLPSSKNVFKSHLTWSEQVGKEKWFHYFVSRRKPWSSCSSVLWSKSGLILYFQSHYQIFAFESPLKISGLLPPPHQPPHPPPEYLPIYWFLRNCLTEPPFVILVLKKHCITFWNC